MHLPTTSSVSLNTVQSFRSEENAEDEGPRHRSRRRVGAQGGAPARRASCSWDRRTRSGVRQAPLRAPKHEALHRGAARRERGAQHLAGYDQIQIVRVHDGGVGCARHAPETRRGRGAALEHTNARHGARGRYGERLLAKRRPPILCISTGAGAGRAGRGLHPPHAEDVGATPVEVIFDVVVTCCSTSRTSRWPPFPGQVSAALTVEDEVDLEDPGQGGLSFDRIDLNATIDGLADDDTRVAPAAPARSTACSHGPVRAGACGSSGRPSSPPRPNGGCARIGTRGRSTGRITTEDGRARRGQLIRQVRTPGFGFEFVRREQLSAAPYM